MNPDERRPNPSATRVSRTTRATTSSRTPVSTKPTLRSVAASTLSSTPIQRPITSTKRDSLQAELEKDPQLSSAKRQQRTQAFTSTLSQATSERQIVSLQAAKNELENKLRDKDAEIERLETERRYLADRETEEKDARESHHTQWEVERRNLNTTLNTLRRTYEALQEEHTDLTEAHDRVRRKGASEQDALRLEVARLTQQLGHLSQQVEEYQAVSEDRARRIAELEAAVPSAPDPETSMADRSSDNIITAELARQTTYISTLERRNERLSSEVDALRARHASVEVLREENRSLHKKLKVVDELRQALGQAEAERDHWQQQSSAKSGDSTQSAELAAEVSRLRAAQAQLADELGNKGAALRVKQTELMVMSGELDAVKRELDAAKSEVDDLKDKERRLNDRVALGEREVGFLKSMVSTYEQEQDGATTVDDTMSVDGDTSTTAINPATALRLQNLESLLAEYKATNEKLAAEIARAAENPSDLYQQTEHLRTELKASEEKHAETLEQLDQLEQTLFELGGEMAGGRYVPPNTRILAATDSPEANWFAARTETLESLKRENEALRQQLSEGDNATMALPQASADAWQHEKAALTQELAQANKRWQRLKQVFNAKAEEFTETVRNVLGVKVAFFGNGSVRVTSVYDLEAQFAFEPMKDGGSGGGRSMRMVGRGRGGGEDVDEQMEYWIRTEGSIPCFLATMTLVSFDKWKHEQRELGLRQ
ncbi:spindle assembly checkpoint component Mad1 [Schizophyllum amplum]|uniref:Spindle assembly checkpoint component MAD1 n=1 Tax=Schizophyllum amplum TaxID=97359 RepID=A0A550CVM5_9AGAR|nr:spindle assembly checkpoint component Mad1 [Auriculariopsis ampla]